MAIYLSVVFLVLVFSRLGNYETKSTSEVSNIIEHKSKIPLVLVLIVLVMCYALRYKTGWDTPGYINIYQNIGQYSLIEIIGMDDPFFFLVNFIDSKIFSGSLILHNTVLGFITYFPVIYLYWRYSRKYSSAALMYLLTTPYFFAFNGQRQGMAVGLAVLAYIMLLKRRKAGVVLFLTLAVLTHSTAIIMIPVYLVSFLDSKRPLFKIVITSLAISFVFLNNLWTIIFNLMSEIGMTTLTERYGDTISWYSGSSILRLLVVFLPVLLGIVVYSRIDYEYKDFSTLLNLNIFTCIFFLGGTSNWLVARLGQYTLPFLPMLLIRLASAFTFESKKIYYVTITILFFIYMIVFLRADALCPYYFIDETHVFY